MTRYRIHFRCPYQVDCGLAASSVAPESWGGVLYAQVVVLRIKTSGLVALTDATQIFTWCSGLCSPSVILPNSLQISLQIKLKTTAVL